MFCSKCGADNADGAKFCAKCGAALALAAPEPAPVVTTTMRSTSDVNRATATSPTGKSPWVAVILSLFITGLGQFYNNDWKKGALMFVGAILGFIFTGGLLTLGFWIWSMVDGHMVASGKSQPW
jgi:TM2 domain-containing membrane protein YozV